MTPKDKERYVVKFVVALLVILVLLCCIGTVVVHSKSEPRVYLPVIQNGEGLGPLPTPAPTMQIGTPPPTDTIIIGDVTPTPAPTQQIGTPPPTDTIEIGG